MFWRSRRNELKASKKKQRALRFEGLEERAVFANDVTVALVGTTLTILGDVNPNHVTITQGTSATEYLIGGLDGTMINGPVKITDPFDHLIVNLGVGSDTLEITGLSAANKLRLAGDVDISIGTGNDVNKLTNVQVLDDFTVTKVADGEGRLTLDGVEVIGDATLAPGGFNGASKTVLTGETHIQGNLTINNNDGEDNFVAFTATIDGDCTITNGDGDTSTTFGENVDPTVFGNLVITNGLGNDKVFIHNTDVWGFATVTNGDGHTLTSVETSDIGLGAPVGDTGDLTLTNGVGFDELTWTTATVRDDLVVDNGGAEVFGSRTTITDSNIGDDLDFDGDAGLDEINFNDVTVVDRVDLDVGEGASETNVVDSTFGWTFDFDGGAGQDVILMDNSTVQGDVTIALLGGIDRVELLNATKLQGSTSLSGGAGIDTLKRQIAPAVDAIVVAFFALEDLELDEFQTS